MKIIPVIDVLNGKVVHAVKGQREHYLPLKSVLCNSINPVDVAVTFEELGFRELYLADLDAITGGGKNFTIYRKIRKQTKFEFMVDAGIGDIQTAKMVLNAGASRIVIGTETLSNISVITEAFQLFNYDQVVVSLDLKSGKIISASNYVRSLDPVFFAKKLEGLGVKHVIVLDLDRVGAECGVNLDLLRLLLDETGLNLMVGGGIKDLGELENLRELGVKGVLLATALHKGKIRIDELKSRGMI